LTVAHLNTDIQVWDLEGQKPVEMAEFAPHHRYRQTWFVDGTVRVWDWNEQIGSQEIYLAGQIRHGWWSHEFCRDGRSFLAVAYVRTTIQVWDLTTNDRRSLSLDYPSDKIDVKLSEDGRYVVTEHGGPCRVWDMETGRMLASHQDARVSSLDAIILPDGQRIGGFTPAWWAWRWRGQVWDCRDGTCRESEEPEAVDSPGSSWQAVEDLVQRRIGAIDAKAQAVLSSLSVAQVRAAVTLTLDPEAQDVVSPLAVTGHPKHSTCAGAAGNHLYLYTLEGERRFPAGSRVQNKD
jgi:WD40 repeat protein